MRRFIPEIPEKGPPLEDASKDAALNCTTRGGRKVFFSKFWEKGRTHACCDVRGLIFDPGEVSHGRCRVNLRVVEFSN